MMTGLFSSKKSSCTACGKQISHVHKPKKSWGVEGPLCADCYVDLMEKNFESDREEKCTACGVSPGSFNLWRPRKEWQVSGWLCKQCFDKREQEDERVKNFCCMCGSKIGFFTYKPKKEWGMEGYMCKKCWNSRSG